jgi:hypothetical protein
MSNIEASLHLLEDRLDMDSSASVKWVRAWLTRHDQLLLFIDLDIGYNMARNLQAKLPSSDTIRVYDINPDSVKRFAQETKALSSGAAVEVASSVREAAEDSVGPPYFNCCVYSPAVLPLCDEFVLSMI